MLDFARIVEYQIWRGVRLGGGGVKEKTAKTWITKQQNLSLKGYSEWYCVNKGSSSAALLFQGYQKTCFNLARGLGASDKK